MAGIPGWVTLPTAARRLGVSRQRVWQLVQQEKLESRELYGRLLVSSESVTDRWEEMKRHWEEVAATQQVLIDPKTQQVLIDPEEKDFDLDEGVRDDSASTE